ncbi:MAG: hypothetical protein ACTHMS_01305 [Jatrophihabitans sp.]|uniref:hypothetical protein n=1 Tax=Jatrophihabitans sp. TaxID=1932789 RepID=UPI003F805ADC
MPPWNDPSINVGTMIRGALWLVQVVGAGNTFTKADLREAFPGVSQADRRIRDLRDYGWVIRASNEDATLLPEEQRFESVGVPVWDPQQRRSAGFRRTLSAREKQAIMARDGYLCVVCGIGAAEPYPDDPLQTAVLAVYQATTAVNSKYSDGYATECKRCHAGAGSNEAELAELLMQLNALAPDERRQLVNWLKRGRRQPSRLDVVWHGVSRLPAELRADLEHQLTLGSDVGLAID